MALKKLKTKNREEWKALRKKYIGGSDAAACVGLNPFSSAYSLWAEKTGKIPEFEGNLATDVGTYLEEFIAKKFEQETGKKVRREKHSIVNDKYPWAIANYDRLVVGEDAGLEIKSTSELNLKRFKNGEYPANYYCQCVHYLAVSEKKRWYLAVLIGNRDFKWFTVERDEDEIEALMAAECAVFAHIQSDTPPQADGSQATESAIKTIYEDSNDDCEVSLAAFGTELGSYVAIGKQIRELEAMQTEIGNKVKAFMGDSGHGFSDRYKVSYSTSYRPSFDTKALMKDHPEIDYIKYQKTTKTRAFRVNEI